MKKLNMTLKIIIFSIILSLPAMSFAADAKKADAKKDDKKAAVEKKVDAKKEEKKEDKKDAKKEDKPELKVGLTLYAHYLYAMSGDMEQKGANAFDITRTYLTLKAKLNDYVKGRLTFDSRVGKLNPAFGGLNVVPKYAYVSFTPLGLLQPKMKDYFWMDIGLVKEPLQHSNKVWGGRFLEKPYLNAYDLMHTADFGLSFHGKVQKMLSYRLTISDGQGYSGKGVWDNSGKPKGAPDDIPGDDYKDTNIYKDYAMDIVITPFANQKNPIMKGIGVILGGASRSIAMQNDTNIIMAGLFLDADKFVVGIDGYMFNADKFNGDMVGEDKGNGYSFYFVADLYKSLFAIGRLDFFDPNNDEMGVAFTKTTFGVGCKLAKGMRFVLDLIHEETEGLKQNYMGFHTEINL